MNMTVRSGLVVVDPADVSASSGFAEQQATVSVEKNVLNDVLERATDVNADPAELQHVVNILMRALAEYPGEVRATIEAYTGAIALAVSTGHEVALKFSQNLTGELEAVPSVPTIPAIDRALARGRERVSTILASPEMLSGRKFAELIGVSPQTLNEWREQRKVLALSGAKRGFRYPDWQLIDETGAPLPGLVELHRLFGDQPWSVYRFLRQNHGVLEGRTGIESLKSGAVDATVAAAKGISDTSN